MGTKILGFRVIGGRETRAKAFQIGQLAVDMVSRVFVVDSDAVELWLLDPTWEQVSRITQLEGIRQVEFTGVIEPENSRAERAVKAQQTLVRNRALMGSPSGLSSESVNIGRWWSQTAPMVTAPRKMHQ